MTVCLLIHVNCNNTFLYSLNAGRPKVSLSYGPSHAEKGKNITLPECHVTSFPASRITWVKVLDKLAQSRVEMKDGQLSVINAQKKDSGLYKCTASNKLGFDSALTQLNVVELPQFTARPPSQLQISAVQNVTVRCQATGDPPPKVTWMKENGVLPVGRSKVSLDGTLIIWNTKQEDSGKYTCVASSSNIFTKAISTMDLTIKQAGKIRLSILVFFLIWPLGFQTCLLTNNPYFGNKKKKKKNKKQHQQNKKQQQQQQQ